MKKFASLAVIVSLASAGLIAPALTAYAGTTDSSTTTTATTTTETYQQRAERIIAAAAMPDDVKSQLRAIVAMMPTDADERIANLNDKLGIEHTQAAEIASSVINPNDYQCQTTPLTRWLLGTLSDWTFEELVIGILLLNYFPTYDALLFGTESKSNTFGRNGEYTNLLTSEMKDLRGFWDIQGGDIQLVPMHGADVFKDVNRLARTIKVLFRYSDEQALALADAIRQFLDIHPKLQGGDHPLFTFNAFASDAVPALGVTKRIIMGDGVLQGYAGIGIDSKVAPRSILAHEYGHQVQFAKNLFESPLTGPEATRRTELMADAFGSYFVVHSRGEALNKARALADQETFYNVGDCGFTSSGHHGTPNQRYNTAGWAIGIANSAADQGHKLTALQFDAKFEAKLPELVAPDAN